MQIEPYDNKDGYRVWLSENEQETVREHYEEDMEKRLAVELCMLGLRSEEVTKVSKEHIRRLQSGEEAYKLRVWESKTGYRETPLPKEVKQMITMLASAKDLKKDEPVIDVTKRTVQRWIKAIGEANEEDNPEWQHLSAHDLRRTWATHTYYRLNASDTAKSVLMRWGGWDDEQTFETNYLGREPDGLASELMQTAGLA
jgi:integrase